MPMLKTVKYDDIIHVVFVACKAINLKQHNYCLQQISYHQVMLVLLRHCMLKEHHCNNRPVSCAQELYFEPISREMLFWIVVL